MLDLEQAGRRLSLTQLAPTPPLSELQSMRGRRARHRRVALAASAAAGIAVAGGLLGWISLGSTRTARVTTSPAIGPSRSAATVVKAAVAATKAAGTAQFEETVTSAARGTAVASIGSVSFATNRWTMTNYQGNPGPTTENAEIRVIGPTTYERPFTPNLPGGGPSQWFETRQGFAGFDWLFFPLNNPDLTASYAGSSSVEGTATYVYDVHIPAGSVSGRTFPAYEIQMWLDNQGRIREATTTRPGGGTIGTTRQTLRISKFGVPVTVAVPSPIVSNP